MAGAAAQQAAVTKHKSGDNRRRRNAATSPPPSETCWDTLNEPVIVWPLRLLVLICAALAIQAFFGYSSSAGSLHESLRHSPSHVKESGAPTPSEPLDVASTQTHPALPHGTVSASLSQCAAEALASAQAALPSPLSRVVILDIGDGNAAFDAHADALIPLAELLSSGGWHLLLLYSGRIGPQASAGMTAVPISGTCALAHGRATIGVLISSSAGADTLLWLRHAWPPLTTWPRYYSPVTSLPALATPAADAGRLLAHFYSPPPTEDIQLCVDGVAAPMLQLGLCPTPLAAGARPLSEAVGLLVPAIASAATSAALAVAAVRTNVLIYRPAFSAALALAAAAHAGKGEAAALEAALAGLADSGYATAVLAPGALCGDANAAYSPPAAKATDPFAQPAESVPDPRPRALDVPELPPPGQRACLLAGCPRAGTSSAQPPLYQPPAAAGLARRMATVLTATAPDAAAALETAAAVWSAGVQAASAPPPPVLPPLDALSPPGDDALSLAAAPVSCFPSRPWRRDIALAIVFNKHDHALAPLIMHLRELWGPLYPLMTVFADLPDAPALGRFACATGRLSESGPHTGDDAHTCLARAAPLAFGRIGVQFLMDDALLAPWHATRFDARRIWLPQAQRVEGNFGPSGDVSVAAAKGTHLGEHFMLRYAEWYALGHMTPDNERMHAANAATLGRGVQLVRGTTDAVYLPRAVLPHFARLASTAAGLYQELFLPTVALAVMRLGDVLPMNIGPRAVPREPAGSAPDKADAGDWHPGDHIVHPWKMGTNAAAAQLALARFRAWYELPPNCSAAPAGVASGGAVDSGVVAARRWPWWHAPAWLAAACVPTYDWPTQPGTTRSDVRP